MSLFRATSFSSSGSGDYVEPSAHADVRTGREVRGGPDEHLHQQPRWYCLHTRPAREAFVASTLRDNLALETYFPRIRREKVVRRVRQRVVRPLFPRYLFCRFSAAEHYRMVRHVAEVIDIVRFGEWPVVVPDSTIADLRSWAGDIVDVDPLLQQLQMGDEVTITEGPMQGLRAVIRYADSDRDRVSLLLSSLECQAQLLISRTRLELVG